MRPAPLMFAISLALLTGCQSTPREAKADVAAAPPEAAAAAELHDSLVLSAENAASAAAAASGGAAATSALASRGVDWQPVSRAREIANISGAGRMVGIQGGFDELNAWRR